MKRAYLAAVTLAALVLLLVGLHLKPARHDPDLALKAAALCETVPPLAFTEDGCSLFPDGSWGHCCLRHDMAYWCGGSFLDRVQADRDLGECVGGNLGVLMYLGVRPGGAAWIPAPTFRWGYGWRWPDSGPP